jgi:hypothetical protein
MRLYDLYNQSSNIGIEKISQIIKVNYNNFTLVEKLIIDRKILFDDDYPTFYWKIIAVIYFMITGCTLLKIDDNYLHNNYKDDITRIRTSSESEVDNNKFKIKSIYDLYINFSESYHPFKPDAIDNKITRLKYNNDYLPSIKDKLIIIIDDYAEHEKFHYAEIEICKNLNFILTIDFSDFYNSLVKFKLEQKSFISYSPIDYSILFMETEKLTNYKQLEYQLGEKFKTNLNNAKLIITRLQIGDCDFNIEILYLVLDVIKKVFPISIAKLYTHSVLFMMKLKNVSISIIMLYNSRLSNEYFEIEPTLEYAVSETYKLNYINLLEKLPFTKENYQNVLSKCNSDERFKYFLNLAKSMGFNDYQSSFIKFSLNNLNRNFTSIDYTEEFPNMAEIFEIVKYDIIKSHIKQNRITYIKYAVDNFNNIDFTDIRISSEVGKSNSLEIFKLIYNDKYNHEILKSVILSNLEIGSDLFINVFPLVLLTKDEIILAISKSNNINLIGKYRDDMCQNIIVQCMKFNIIDDNIIMFCYFWNNTSHRLFCIDSYQDFIKIAINYNRLIILRILLNGRYQPLSFYLPAIINYLKESKVNIYILNLLFHQLNMKWNEPISQLIFLKPIIELILNSNNKELIQWLNENVKLQPLFKMKFINNYNDYISSDSDFDSELDMKYI